MYKGYLLGIITASLICGIVTKFHGKSSLVSSITRLVTTLFLTLTVFASLISIELPEIAYYFDELKMNAENIMTAGKDAASNATASIILEKTEAYILDKAADYGAKICIDFESSNQHSLIPEQITVIGNVSPYVKRALEKIIAEDVGICEENQKWITNN